MHASPLHSPRRACSAPSPPTPWTWRRWATRSPAPTAPIPSMMSGSPSVTPSPCSCLRTARLAATPEHSSRHRKQNCIKSQQPNNNQDCETPFNSISCLFQLVEQCRDYTCNVTNIVVEPPSPESSPDSDGCTPVSKRRIMKVNILLIFHIKAGKSIPCRLEALVGQDSNRIVGLLFCLCEK